MPDVLGWRCKFGTIGPSTNTVVQPDFDAMRPPGVTNHYSRIYTPNAAALSNEMPSAALGPAEDDTIIVIAPEPVAVPAEREDNAVDDEQPAHTGSVITARSGDAIVFPPEVHVAIPAPVLSSE